MASEKYTEGGEEIAAALHQLADQGLAEWKTTLRSAVRDPMRNVMKRAEANIAVLSPGKSELHRTYKGNWVGAGFASRSIRMNVRLTKQGSVAVLGVLSEAFYALSFFELGVPSRGIARQPWLTTALEASKEQALREVGAAMRKRIDAIWRRNVRKAKLAAAAAGAAK